ncbi:MAG TPA: PaaI family thioesterase [Chondromyces sp.]|nr:PaaI family thioesterase [Chondromyces sp.]
MKAELQSLLEQCIQESSEEGLEILNQLLTGYLDKNLHSGSYVGRILHMEKKILNETECEVTIPVNGLVHNQLEIVHGGVTATLLDSAMGSLAMQCAPPDHGVVTSNLNIHYVAPGIGNSLTAKASLIHKGSKTMVVEGTVYREDGKKVAHATGTFFIVKA